MKKLTNIHDFTHVETIYNQELHTIRVKLKRNYIASDEVALQTIRRPYDVYQILKTIFATLDEDREHLILLILDLGQNIQGYKVITSGGQNYAIIDLKVIFRNALLLGASGIILAHNHPSGKRSFSDPDLDLTEKVVQTGQLLEIEVLDHIIYTPDDGYTSLKEVAPFIFKVG